MISILIQQTRQRKFFNQREMKIVNNYKFEALTLGVGSYSIVRLATHIVSGKQVAVKVVNINVKTNQKCLIQEVRALCRLNHQNIVKLHHFTCDEEYAYLFLEYLPNHINLNHYMERVGTIAEQQALIVFRQLVNAVHYCHCNNFAHHDIKLENILLSPNSEENNLLLIDFGLSIVFSKERDAKTEDYSGSPLYMPPEVINRIPYDAFMADIWSMGVILYYLLCNEFPFQAESFDELVTVVTMDNLEVPDYVSEHTRKLLHRLLDKNPQTRITIEEVRNMIGSDSSL